MADVDISTRQSPPECQQPTELVPIQRLPIETFTDIIFAILGNEPLDKDGRVQLVKIMLVSSAWRRIALGTPALWTTINFDVTSLTSARFRGVLDWFGRSGYLPKTLELTTSQPRRSCTKILVNSDCPWNDKRLGLLVDCIRPSLTRLILPLMSLRCLSQLLIDPSAPSWKTITDFSVSIRDLSLDDASLQESAKLLRTLPPGLSSLSIYMPQERGIGDPTFYLEGIPATTYSQLTSLSITAYMLRPGALHLVALQHCANLERLRLDLVLSYADYGWDEEEDWKDKVPALVDPGYITLPKLQFLDVVIVNSVLDLLWKLRAPNLVTLHIELDNDYDYPVPTPKEILDTIKLISPQQTSVLKSLTATLWMTYYNWLCLDRFLTAIPSLVHVAVRDLDKWVEKQVDNSDERQARWPYPPFTFSQSLETLEFQDLPKDFNVQLACDFVRRRSDVREGERDGVKVLWARPGSLKYVNLYYREQPSSLDDASSRSVAELRGLFDIQVQRFFDGTDSTAVDG